MKMNVDLSKRRARGRFCSRSKVAGYLGAFLIACAMAASSGVLRAQSEDQPAPSMVPPPDPGYGLYYHDSEASPDFADRWGYHDGWTDGRHDRNHGDTFEAADKDHFKLPPEHGGHPGITRDQYVKNYRSAYLRGYQHGSRI